MKLYATREVDEAVAHAADGGQALHLHTVVFPSSPRCFRAAVARGEWIAHLFDADRDRLVATAKRLGVRVVHIDRDNTPRQHIDLCGKPLQAAFRMLDADQAEKLAELMRG